MIVLIDLDDTLIVNTFSRGVFPYLARMFEEAKPGINYLSSFEQEGIKRRRDRKLVESYDWDSIIESVASSFNLIVKIDVGEIVRMFCKPPYISLADNAIELLHALRSNLHEVILVSNGYLKYQRPVIEALRLESSFDSLVTSDKIGFVKPQPEFFEYAIKSARSREKKQAMIVGDSLLNDIWGGAVAGLTPIFLSKSVKHRNSHFKLANLRNEISLVSRKEGLEWFVQEIPDVEIRCIKNILQLRELIS